MDLLNDIVVFFIFLFLGIITLRDIIAMSGIVPYNLKISNFIYGKRDLELLKNVFIKLGYKDYEALKIIKRLKPDVENVYQDKSIKNLLYLMRKYICKFDKDIEYGQSSPVETKYYVNTASASHNEKDLELMSALISNLIISDHECNPIEYKKIDFILVPKEGNTLLASRLAKMKRCQALYKKSNNDGAYIYKVKSNFFECIQINYEGTYQMDFFDRKLYGIAIDCNITDGTKIINMMKEFNEFIDVYDLNIEKVTNAYTLFRTYTNYFSIDDHFMKSGFKIRRYLEINEEIKEKLYKRLSILKNDILSTKDDKIIDKLIKELFEINAIKCSLYCMFKMDNCFFSPCKNAKRYYRANSIILRNNHRD